MDCLKVLTKRSEPRRRSACSIYTVAAHGPVEHSVNSKMVVEAGVSD